MAESSAIKALQEKLFAHRSELMSAFQQYDIYNTGKITQINVLVNTSAHSFSILLFFSFHFFLALSQAGSPPMNGLK